MEKNNKHFPEWMKLKERLHFLNRIRQIHEGEVWWCSIGENIGVEEYGKGESFLRPVIVFRKLSRFGFLGIPLTSKERQGSWYVSFEFNGRRQTALLVQIRHFSVARLQKRMGQLSKGDFKAVNDGFMKFLNKN